MVAAFSCAALLALVMKCRPPQERSFSTFLARNGVKAEVVTVKGPDHTTKETASTLGLPDDTAVVKSLVFVVDGVTVMVLARGCDRVSVDLLQQHIRAASSCKEEECRLASHAEAEAATGFRPGCIPPLWPEMRPDTRVVFDESIRSGQTPVVYAGTGVAGDHLRITPEELWRAASALACASCARVVVEESPPQRRPQPRPRNWLLDERASVHARSERTYGRSSDSEHSVKTSV